MENMDVHGAAGLGGLFLDGLSEGIVVMQMASDSRGRASDCIILDVNTAFEKLSGIKKDKVLGRSANEFLRTAGPGWLEKCAGVTATGEPARFEFRNGASGRQYGVHVYSLRDGQRLIAVFKDTEPKWSEEENDAFFKASSQAVYRMNPDWSAMYELYGRGFLADTKEPDTSWMEKYIPPDDRSYVTAVIREAIQTKGVFEMDHRVLLADGSVGWTHSRAVPILDGKGDIAGWFGAAGDITVRKNLDERAALFAGIGKDFSDFSGVGDILMAVGDRIVRHFDVTAGLSLCEPDEENGQIAVHYGCDRAGTPGSRAEMPLMAYFSEKILRLLKSGSTIAAEDVKADPLTVGEAGEWISSRARSALVVPYTMGGRLMFVITLQYDKTHRWQKNETALVRELAERIYLRIEHAHNAEKLIFQAHILESIHDAVVAVDAQDIVTYWNGVAEKITGWTAKEIVGRTGTSLIQRFIADYSLEDFTRDLQAEGSYTGTVTYLKKDADYIFLDVHIRLIHGKGREILGAVATFRDVTERKLFEKTLGEREKEHLEIIDSSTEGSFIRDMEKGEIQYSNVWKKRLGLAQLTPYEAEKANAMTIHPDDRAAVERAFRLACAEKAPKVKMEFRVNTEDAGYIWILGQGKIVYDAEGRPIKCFGTHMDITARKRQEEALAFQAHLLSNVQEAISAYDENMRIIYWNETAERMYGWTAAEVIGRPSKDLSRVDVPDFTRIAAVEKMLREGGYSGEVVFYHKDGRPVHTEVHTKVLKDPDGRFLGAVTSFRDISERKEREEKISRQNAVLQAINQIYVKSVSCPTEEELGIACLATVEAVTKSGFSFISELGSDGFLHDIAVSLPGWELCEMRDCTGHRKPPGNFPMRGLYASAITTGHALLTNDPAKHPDSLGLPEGHPPVRSLLAVPFFRNGKAAGVIAVANRDGGYAQEQQEALEALAPTIQEVLYKKRAEEALRASEKNARSLAKEQKALKDDLSEEVEALNKLHLVGSHFIRHENTEKINRDILDAAIAVTHADKGHIQLLFDDGQNMAMAAYIGFKESYIRRFDTVPKEANICGAACLRGCRVIIRDIRRSGLFTSEDLKYLAGEEIRCVQSTPMFSSIGNLVGFLTTHYRSVHVFKERELRMLDLLARQSADVIERTRMEEALLRSEQQALAQAEELKGADRNKNEFISALSHELRNPLAAIVAGITLLDVAEDAGRKEKAKAIMRREVKQLCRLVDDLLELTRITRNKIELKKESMELKNLASTAAEDLNALFKEKGVTLETDISGEPLYILADPVRLTQSIGNLLHNALKFTDKGGRAALSVLEEDGEAVIRVTDNGIGIKSEFLPSLFEPFTQADHSLDRAYGGLGLGLSIAKGIAELHGGSISAASDGLGKGAEFTIRLPLGKGDTDSDRKVRPDKEPRRLKILVIEDNRDLCEILCDMFEQMGHTAAASRNGIEGVAMVKDLKPDVLFCDIGLPGMNGYEVIREIREDANLRGLYAVALTGYAGSLDMKEALGSGFNLHVAKPVDMATLERILDQVKTMNKGQ